MSIPVAFLNRKKQFMEKLDEAKRKNLVDRDVIPLLDIINSLPFAYTTSSCSGRIMLIDIPPSEKKFESNRIARWHFGVDFDTFWRTILDYKPFGTLWLKVDSFIIAFAVSSLNWAKYLIKLARFLGLKYSGIRSINLRSNHIFMDVASTEHVHLPISDSIEGLLIDERYARFIHKVAMHKLMKTKTKMKKFERAMTLLRDLYFDGKIDPTREDFSAYESIIKNSESSKVFNSK